MNGKRGAFTLIELLIVVAIIAILAAIAVPNFLEAQVRSKVARVKGDMRSLATAIESYMVDYNRPPAGWNECLSFQPKCWGVGANKPVALGLIYRQITSPIAYMTAIPADPFTIQGSIGTKGASTGAGLPFEYHSIRSSYTNTAYAQPQGFKDAARAGFTWLMYSVGPSRRLSPDPSMSATGALLAAALAGAPSTATEVGNPDIFYDPTNGTASYGWLVRSNKQQH